MTFRKALIESLVTDLIAENIEKKRPHLQKELQKHEPDVKKQNQIIDWVAEADPVAIKSKNKKTKFVNTILKWYLKGSIRLPEDVEATKATLAKFIGYSQKNKEVRALQLDTFDSPGKLEKAVDEITGGELSDVDSSYPYLKTVDRIPGYVMYEVSSHDQMVKCGKNTKWCVTGSMMFRHYGPPYYLITKENGERFALIHVGSTQIKDEYDAALSVEDMMKIKPFLEKLFSNNREKGTHSSLQSRLFDRSRNKDQKNLMDVISAKEGLPDFTVSSFNRIKYSPDVMEKIEKVFSANVIRNDAMTSRNTLFIDTDLTADFAGLDNYQPTITLRMYYKAMESSIRMKLSKEPQSCVYLSKGYYEDTYYYGYFPKERIMKGFARLKKNLEEHIAKEEAANQV